MVETTTNRTGRCGRCAELSALYAGAVLEEDPAAELAALITAVVHTTDTHGAHLSGKARCGTCRQFLMLLRGDPAGRELDLTGWRRDAALHFSAHVLADRTMATDDAGDKAVAAAAALAGV